MLCFSLQKIPHRTPTLTTGFWENWNLSSLELFVGSKRVIDSILKNPSKWGEVSLLNIWINLEAKAEIEWLPADLSVMEASCQWETRTTLSTITECRQDAPHWTTWPVWLHIIKNRDSDFFFIKTMNVYGEKWKFKYSTILHSIVMICVSFWKFSVHL